MNEPSSEQPEPVNLSSMTKSELLDYAEKNGIEGVGGDMKKADILDVLEEE